MLLVAFVELQPVVEIAVCLLALPSLVLSGIVSTILDTATLHPFLKITALHLATTLLLLLATTLLLVMMTAVFAMVTTFISVMMFTMVISVVVIFALTGTAS